MAVTIATGVVSIRPDIDEGDATRAANQAGQRTGDAFVRGMDGRLRDARGRFVGSANQLGDSMNNQSGRTNRFARSISGLIGAAAGAGRALLGAAGSFVKVGMAAGAAIPLIAGVVAALQNIAPVAAGAATAVTAFAMAAAAIKIGTSGIGSAITAAFAPTAKAAGGATNAAKQHAQAMGQVQDATEAAARANADAARRVKDAEEDLADAQREAIQIQKELSEARRDAKRELEDLNSALAHGELDLKSATMELTEAEKHYREVTAINSTATKQEQEEALLRLEEAKLRLSDQRTEVQRLREDTAAANKEGINGTEAMTSWRERMQSANENVASQEKALADARREQAQTAKDGQEAIKDAMAAVANVTSQSATPAVNKFADAMAKLSPNARAFVQEIIRLKPAWDSLKLSVQDALFAGLAGKLRETAGVVLPILKTNLTATAGILNQMGKGAADAAIKMGQSGALGQAMAGANLGLKNLIPLPGKLIQAFTQVAAAGAPVFQELTKNIADGVSGMAERVNEGFESGALAESIQTAMDLVKQLGTVFGNLGEIFNNVFGQFTQSGGGVINLLVEITDAIAKATATKGFQDAIAALGETFAVFAQTAGPLLGEVLAAIAPILTELGPPVQTLIRDLGAALTPIVQALAPILGILAQAVGNILTAFSPLLPVIGELIASLLPVFEPMLQAVADAFVRFGPLVEMVGQMLKDLLVPVIAQLAPIMEPLVEHFKTMTDILFPILSQLLIALMPSIQSIGQSFGQLLVAVAPLITALATLLGGVLTAMAPMLTPIIELVGKLAAILADQLASLITNVVVPALSFLTNLLSGNFSAAWDALGDTISGIWTHIKNTFGNIVDIVKSVIGTIVGIFQYLYDVLIGHSIIPDLVNGVINWFKNLGKRAAEAFQNMWNWVVAKVRGMRDGVVNWIRSMRDGVVNTITSARDRANSIMNQLKDWVVGKARTLRDNVAGAFNGMKDKAIEAFRRAKDGIGEVWKQVKKLAAAPVNFVIGTVYNNGIRKFWNFIAGKIGLGKLDSIPLLKFQKGGVADLRAGAKLPGFSRTDDTLAMVRSGEGVLVPEAVNALGGANFINSANRMKGRAGKLMNKQGGKIPGFFLGGIVDAVGGFIDKGKDFFKDGFVKALNGVTAPIINSMKEKFGTTGFKGLPTNAVIGIVNKIKGFLGPKAGELEGGDGRKVVSTARSQTGYYGRPNKFTKAPGMWTDEWCGMFVDWVFKKSNAYKALSPVKGTPAVRSYTALPKVGKGSMRPGDLALYRGDTGHINIVTDPKTKETVGGNESNNEVKKSFGYVNSASSIRRPKFARGGLVDRRMLRLAGGWDQLRDIRWQDRKESPHVSTTDQAKRDLFAPPPWVSRDMGGLLPDGVAAVNTSGTAEVVSTLDQLKALVAAGKGQTFIFNEGAITLDASKIKSLQDLVDMINALKVTSRQFGARI